MEIAPEEVKRRLDAGERVHLIDVREPQEFALARIEGSELFPMRALPETLGHLLSLDGNVVVFCHHGVRSRNAVQWLRGRGVANCVSMAGGIDAWSLRIDPSVPRY